MNNPVVTSVAASVSSAVQENGQTNQTISESDVVNQLEVLVTFDQRMDESSSSTPVVTFKESGSDITPADRGIAIDPVASGWVSATEYKAVYDLTDSNDDVNDLEVQISGARDFNGNAQATHSAVAVINIDTIQPPVTLTASTESTSGNAYSQADLRALLQLWC